MRPAAALAGCVLVILTVIPAGEACTSLPVAVSTQLPGARSPELSLRAYGPCPPPYPSNPGLEAKALGMQFRVAPVLRIVEQAMPSGVPVVTPLAAPDERPAATLAPGDDVQPVRFHWPAMVPPNLRVVIVPPAHGQLVNDMVLGGAGASELVPWSSSYVQAMKKAVGDWQKAAHVFSPVLLGGLALQVSVVGPGFNLADLGHADIVVGSVENMGHIGGFGGLGFEGGPCFVVTSMWFVLSFSFSDMANIFSHELGHCLGLDHASGGPGFHDGMMANYDHAVGSSLTHLRCPSNLNIRGLEQGLGLAPFVGFAAQAPAAYQALPC